MDYLLLTWLTRAAIAVVIGSVSWLLLKDDDRATRSIPSNPRVPPVAP
jgi:hypothetical protein